MMASAITIVVLSPRHLDYFELREFVKNPYDNVLNHVSEFDDAAGLLRENVRAIQKVTTPYFCLHDWDDPAPVIPGTPGANGILYGDYIYKSKGTGGREAVMPTPDWTAEKHLANYLFVHRAVCNTAHAKRILPLLPEGEFLYFFLLYFLLADNFGAVYDPFFWSCWDKQETGMHRKIGTARRNTHAWLLAHREEVKARLASTS